MKQAIKPFTLAMALAAAVSTAAFGQASTTNSTTDDTATATKHTTKAHRMTRKTTHPASAARADTKAQNSDMHRTDEPFRDDVGRSPGATP